MSSVSKESCTPPGASSLLPSAPSTSGSILKSHTELGSEAYPEPEWSAIDPVDCVSVMVSPQ